MISVAYRTSHEMFCDVKLHFSQLLKAQCFDGRHFWDFIYLMKKCLPAKKITIWSINKSEVKVRILQHNFEQFSCIKRRKIYYEIFGCLCVQQRPMLRDGTVLRSSAVTIGTTFFPGPNTPRHM